MRKKQGKMPTLTRMKRIKRLLRFPLMLRARAKDRALAQRSHHYLAVCAIFRDEAQFFDEWIRFHLGVGASHFFLYNNFSKDDYCSALAPWIARGLVTLHEWPVESGQKTAYRDCTRRHCMEARWIAFIDIDEFLFAPGSIDLRPVLKEFEDLPGVIVGSLFFGSSGHVTAPCGPLLEAFTERSVTVSSGKTIANPRQVRAIRSSHAFWYFDGESLDTSRAPVSHAEAGGLPSNVLRINHYWSRSLEDLKRKVSRRNVWTGAPYEWAASLEFERRLNDERDLSILPVVRAVRSQSISLEKLG